MSHSKLSPERGAKNCSAVRPLVYDYRTPAEFLAAMMIYHRQVDPRFSIRQRTRKLPSCSPSLVSQVLKSRKRLTRDQLPAFGQLFKLNATEIDFLDECLKNERSPARDTEKPQSTSEDEPPAPRNHLLHDWLNVYVKDSCHLKGFAPDAATLFRILGGIAPPSRIARSISFLMREGFWRTNERGKIVPDAKAVLSTKELPNRKIRQLHRQALKIAQDGLEKFPPERRKAGTIVISVNEKSISEIRGLLDRLQRDLERIIQKYPDGNEQLCQVTFHLTPIGGNDAFAQKN